MYEHKVPTLLNEPDRFLLNCTARQIAVLGCGVACGYLLLTSFDLETLQGWLLGIPLALLAFLCTMVVAFLKIKHRYLEQWALVGYLYASMPKIFLWRPLDINIASETDEQEQAVVHNEEEQELW